MGLKNSRGLYSYKLHLFYISLSLSPTLSLCVYMRVIHLFLVFDACIDVS